MTYVNGFKKAFVLLLIFALLGSIGCEPYPSINFDNRQNQEIIIFAAHVRDDGTTDNFVKQGVVPARSIGIVKITFIGDKWINRIEARDSSGNLVFSHDYAMPDLEKVGWKIVLPP